MLYIFPYIATLAYWVMFFAGTALPAATAPLFGVLAVAWALTVAVIGRRNFGRLWVVWLNLFLYLATSYGLALIIASEPIRNVYIVLSGLLCGIFLHVVLPHVREPDKFLSRLYLEFISFVYLVAFWQFFVLVYFAIISYNWSVWRALPVALVGAVLLARGILAAHTLKKSFRPLVTAVLVTTTLELFVFLQLLPLHYFVLSAMLSVWFYSVIEVVLRGQDVSSRRRLFRSYAGFALVAMILLLITARWG